MKRIWLPFPIFYIPIILFSFWIFFAFTSTIVLAQQATETPAAQGMYITVLSDEPFANVRMGPSSTIYPKVGILYPGDTAPALGRSPGGDWVQIEYPGAPYDKGWVYSPLVQVSPGTLLVIEPPPTPVPPATSTIDPTLAAQFVIVPTNTRLPTFTPPSPSISSTYAQVPSQGGDNNSIPLGIIIVAFAVLGVIGFLLSLVLRR